MTAEKNAFVTVLNNLTVREITDRFHHWYQAAHAGTSVDELLVSIRTLCAGCFFQTVKVSREVFFRARRCAPSQYFESTADLWYPPPHAVTAFGRANRATSPMLYLAQDGRTALFESRLSPGEHVVVAEITIRKDCSLNLQYVGAIKKFAAIDASHAVTLKGQGFDANGVSNVELIHRFLGEEFMREVAPGNEQDYAVSVAIAEFFLSYPESDGLVFPSKKSPNDFNVVFKPDAADRKLVITKCVGLEIADSTPRDIGFRYRNASKELRNDGTIVWHNEANLPELGWKSGATGVLRGPFRTAEQVKRQMTGERSHQ